jgi:hypothetical protein
MTRKILFVGWDTLSIKEQDAIHAWVKGLLDAQVAKQRFLDIYCFQDCPDSEVQPQALSSEYNLTPYDENYMFVSSESEEENFIGFNDFVELIILEARIPDINRCQECRANCQSEGTDERIKECRRRCRENECR